MDESKTPVTESYWQPAGIAPQKAKIIIEGPSESLESINNLIVAWMSIPHRFSDYGVSVKCEGISPSKTLDAMYQHRERHE